MAQLSAGVLYCQIPWPCLRARCQSRYSYFSSYARADDWLDASIQSEFTLQISDQINQIRLNGKSDQSNAMIPTGDGRGRTRSCNLHTRRCDPSTQSEFTVKNQARSIESNGNSYASNAVIVTGDAWGRTRSCNLHVEHVQIHTLSTKHIYVFTAYMRIFVVENESTIRQVTVGGERAPTIFTLSIYMYTRCQWSIYTYIHQPPDIYTLSYTLHKCVNNPTARQVTVGGERAPATFTIDDVLDPSTQSELTVENQLKSIESHP